METLLGRTENNVANPDIEGIELKAHRSKVNSLITLFTFNNKAWKMPSLKAICKSLVQINNRTITFIVHNFTA
ncbi:MAG: MvaI/BcnI family restriction endonuclease [Endomicrobium sp.]|uniref:MvaI/BcnI family restriction endonuclease n=1 Tax=Candidatus Endomicrobiellum pyrsonymphae TaxID=1408203 RepID=UPI00357D6B4B|nr:MvaI/BcnI family restriction endonuclease [Endomicrobium sp.]